MPITLEQLKAMDYAHQAQPFVNVPAKSTVSLPTMDYAYQAQPFVAYPSTTLAGGLSIPVAMHHYKVMRK